MGCDAGSRHGIEDGQRNGIPDHRQRQHGRHDAPEAATAHEAGQGSGWPGRSTANAG